MPSSNSAPFALLAATLLAGCGGGDGYEDAPRIEAPRFDGEPVQRQVAGEPMIRAVPEPQRPEGAERYPAPPELDRAAGPRGDSDGRRYDTVAVARVGDVRGGGGFSAVSLGVATGALPVGRTVELTSLDSGRTILALVVASGGGMVLSPGAAQALGVDDGAAVRLRTVTASPQDEVALRSGGVASPRIDAPPALLKALRKRVGHGSARAAPQGVAPAPDRPNQRGYLVQVAALSSSERAEALAAEIGGRVVRGGNVYRVQLGPFADAASAARARDDIARRGFADARVVRP